MSRGPGERAGSVLRLRRIVVTVILGICGGTVAVTAGPSGAAPVGGGSAALVADPAGDPIIAAAGDIVCDPTIASPDPNGRNPAFCQHRATSDLLVGQPLAAVLALGDLQYERGTLAAFRAAYEPTWGRVKPLTRPAPGNHEYYTSGATGYYDYFGQAAGPRGRGYYSYDVGAWHLIALNSNCTIVSCGPGSTQETWLRADLAAHRTDCTLAYWHHPLFPMALSDAPQTSALWRVMYDEGADVVLNGHEHNYQRFRPQDPSGAVDLTGGIRQFVVGTGGKNHRRSEPAANRQVNNDSAYGVLQMTLRPRSYQWSFVGTQGEVLDSGTAGCSLRPGSSPSPSPSPSPLPSPSAGSGAVTIDVSRRGTRHVLLSGTTSPSSAGVTVSVYRVAADGREVLLATTTTDSNGGWAVHRRFLRSGVVDVVARAGNSSGPVGSARARIHIY